MRIEQPEGSRGSLKWIQRLVDQSPRLLEQRLQEAGALVPAQRVNWCSPLRADAWAEYRDSTFLEKIGLAHLSEDLKQFWPKRGPQWDALGYADSGRVFLIEAKAHGQEMASSCQAGKESRKLIAGALDSCKRAFDAKIESDWMNGYYQYANRLAHLHFLQSRGIDACLVFLYFVGDSDIGGPSSEREWTPFIEAAQSHLGISMHRHGMVTVFQSVHELSPLHTGHLPNNTMQATCEDARA